MKTLIKCCIFALLTSFIGQNMLAQDLMPNELTKKYYMGQLKKYKAYFISPTIDQDFDPRNISQKTAINLETLFENREKTVIAVSVEGKDEYNDSYVFWINQNGWKIQAIRSLWLPGVFHIMLERCKNLDNEGIQKLYQEILDESKNNDSTISEKDIVESMGTVDDFNVNIQTMKLAVSKDKDLIAHFNKNKEKFNALLEKVKLDKQTASPRWKFDYKSVYKKEMQEILISGISNSDNEKIISFVIGGMVDNFVGYFYCPNETDLPQIEPNRFIMIRPMGDGWYFYKTT